MFLVSGPVSPISSFAQEKKYGAGSIAEGKRIFDRTCSVCHGLDGEGQGDLGFKLTAPTTAAWTDEQIVDKIKFGNAPKGMPRFDDAFLEEGKLRDFGSFRTPIDFQALVAYLRHLQDASAKREADKNKPLSAPGTLSAGDPRKGKAVFEQKAGCQECHRIAGRGGQAGPELTQVGARLDRDRLFEALKAPSRTIAADFRMKELTLGRGRTVSGIYRNETSASIEVYDVEKNEWIRYDKTTIQFYRPLRRSLMPDNIAGGLTEAELADLLAYLSQLR